jgi:hypothetical protein
MIGVMHDVLAGKRSISKIDDGVRARIRIAWPSRGQYS